MTMHDTSASAGQALDPVCGMTVDMEDAGSRHLTAEHEGTTYYFCSRGCKLDFEEDPGTYLDPGYVPSM
jgi:Cu+-exporting ATPase